MPTLPDKQAVFDAVVAAVRAQLEQSRTVLQHAQSAATDNEAKAENKYDTRGLEMSFVAAGQTDRIAALRQVLSAYHFWPLPPAADVIRPGALVRLIADDEPEGDALRDPGAALSSTLVAFVAPYGNADTVSVDGVTVRVITLRAPLGRALVGKQEGDEVQVTVAGRTRVWEVDAVS